MVVLHDRPEVRRFVGSLLGDEFAAARVATSRPVVDGLDPAVMPQVGAVCARGPSASAASDIMPTRVAGALAQ